MIEHLFQVHALCEIHCEAATDEVLDIGAHGDVLWESECASTNLFVGLLDLLGLKRRSTVKHCVGDHADGPVVDFVAVATVLENLGSEVVRSSTNCSFLLALVEDLGSEAEVADFKTHSVGQEEVSKLEVAVNDLARMDVLHCQDELVDIVAGFHLVESLAALDQVRQRLVRADVQHDVHILFVFKVAVEADDVLVGERAMNFDFTGQLLTGLRAGQVGLGHHLEGPGQGLVLFSLDWFDSFDLVALSEASLPKEAATLVANELARFVLVFRVYWLHLLFDQLKTTKNRSNSILLGMKTPASGMKSQGNLRRGSDSCQCERVLPAGAGPKLAAPAARLESQFGWGFQRRGEFPTGFRLYWPRSQNLEGRPAGQKLQVPPVLLAN